MKYVKIREDGKMSEEWGGDPLYWMEINDRGDAVRQIEEYPNGHAISYDRTHTEDEFGALNIMVIEAADSRWDPYVIPEAAFQAKWSEHRPLNRERAR